jgi:two-component system CheB/CheR fusion protein
MKNLLDSIDIPVLFLDNTLRIKRFTSQASRIINLIDSDIGRPVSDIASKLEGVNLREIAAAVLKDLVFREKEIRSTDGSWYAMRVAPYRTMENVIDGVVISFVNITRIRNAQAETARLGTILKDANDAVIVWNLDGRIMTWNRGAENMYGYTEAEAKKKNIMDLVPADKQVETNRFIEAVKAGREVTSFKTQRQTRDGRVLDVWLTVTRMPGADGGTPEIVTTERDLNWLREGGEIAE